MWRCTEVEMKKQLWLAWQRVASAKQLHQQLAWRRSGERPEKHETATERSAMSSTEEQKCPKTTYHTITVALMWQMVFSRPIWLLLGFLPNSQVQGEGWKEAKKQRPGKQTASSKLSSRSSPGKEIRSTENQNAWADGIFQGTLTGELLAK